MIYLDTYKKFNENNKSFHISNQIRSIDYDNNLPFYGMNDITSKNDLYNLKNKKNKKIDGEQPKIPRNSNKDKYKKSLKSKRNPLNKPKKVIFKIDQNNYKNYYKAGPDTYSEPGKSFGVGT